MRNTVHLVLQLLCSGKKKGLLLDIASVCIAVPVKNTKLQGNLLQTAKLVLLKGHVLLLVSHKARDSETLLHKRRISRQCESKGVTNTICYKGRGSDIS